VKQAVQVIAWLDTENYQTWVREVLAVHLNVDMDTYSKISFQSTSRMIISLWHIGLELK
jgi:hypothetical protein